MLWAQSEILFMLLGCKGFRFYRPKLINKDKITEEESDLMDVYAEKFKSAKETKTSPKLR